MAAVSNPGDEEATLGAPPARAKPESLLGQPTGGAHIQLVLTQGPGAWLYKGKDERGRRSLIQIVPLRPCDPEEVRARDDLLRQVAAATALLGQDPEVKVESHGFDPDLGLGGCFYWLLQWTGAAERIGQTSLKDGPALVAAAMALLDRVASRHARGRHAPVVRSERMLGQRRVARPGAVGGAVGARHVVRDKRRLQALRLVR